MTPDDLGTVMELVEAHWSWPMSATEVLAWKRNLRPLDFDQLVEVLDGIAGTGVKFRPTVGFVVDSYRAKSRARYAPDPVVIPEALPKEDMRRHIAHAREILGPTGRHHCAREAG